MMKSALRSTNATRLRTSRVKRELVSVKRPIYIGVKKQQPVVAISIDFIYYDINYTYFICY